MNKKNLLALSLCALSSFVIAGCGSTTTSSGTTSTSANTTSTVEEAFGAAKDFTIDAATGAYSFKRVNGADKYKIYIYNQADYDMEANAPVSDDVEAQIESTVSQSDSATITGTIAWVSTGAWGKYVAVVEAIKGSEKASTAVAYTHGGKLSTPEFYVWQGTAQQMNFGPTEETSEETTEETSAAPAEETSAAASEETSEESGGAMPDFGGGDASSSQFVMQITINTDNYLKNEYASEAVYSYAYQVKDANGNVVASSDCFADNIEPAGFTLYTNNTAELTELTINGVATPLTDLYGQTFYVTVKANGCEADNVTDSDWSEAFVLTITEGSTIPFDAGFGRASSWGSFAGGDTEGE